MAIKPLVAGLLLIPAVLGAVFLLTIITDSPGNFLLARGVFYSGSVPLATVVLILYFLVPPIIFWSVGNRLFSARPEIPVHSLAVLLLGTVLSILYFVRRREVGLSHQGESVVNGLAVADAASVLILVALAVRGRLRPSTRTSSWFHWLLALWVCSLAFPYLGGSP